MSLNAIINNPNGCRPLCPGCTHGKMRHQQSLAAKQQRLAKHLSPWISRLTPVRAAAPEARWRYRSSVCLKTAWDASGWRFGLVARKIVIPIHDCPVHAETVCRAVAILAEKLPDGSVFPLVYYLQSGAQATLVVKQNTLPDMSWLTGKTVSRLETAGIEGLWVHLHPAAGRRVLGKNGWRLAWGRPVSMDADGLEYGPVAFRQVIDSLAEHALSTAETFLNPRPEDLMIDLYCGIGAGLVRWTRKQCRTIGVELGQEAVSCAQRNAPAATLLRGRCGLRLPQLTAWIDSRPAAGKPARLLYANPPRTGIEDAVLKWIISDYRPDRMAYLSCNAASLSRDLRFLASNGYEVGALFPYDFFPRTHHVECLALLTSHRHAAD